MLWTVLPAMVFCSMGTVRSRPSFRSSSKRMSSSVRSVFRCSACSSSVVARFSRFGSHARILLEASLKTRKPRSPANIGFSSRIFFPAGADVPCQFGDVAGLLELVAEIAGVFWSCCRVSGSGSCTRIYRRLPPSVCILCHDRMASCAGTRKEIQNDVVLVATNARAFLESAQRALGCRRRLSRTGAIQLLHCFLVIAEHDVPSTVENS